MATKTPKMVTVKYTGEGRTVVYGKYMYPGETRSMTKKQADALVKAKKGFRILGGGKKETAKA